MSRSRKSSAYATKVVSTMTTLVLNVAMIVVASLVLATGYGLRVLAWIFLAFAAIGFLGNIGTLVNLFAKARPPAEPDGDFFAARPWTDTSTKGR